MPNMDSLARAVAGQLPNFLAAGVLVFLFGLAFSYWFRRESPARRFAIWFWGLVALAAIPLLAVAGAMVGTEAPALTKASAPVSLPSSWALYLFFGWVAIAGIALTRVGLGLRHVYLLRRHCVAVEVEDLAPELQAILARFQATRSVAILLSEEIQSPTALGLFGAAVVLPKWILKELTTSELEQVLLHELAHLRRYDDWSNLTQKIVKAMFFFHPAVWWMENKLSLEREMACDEAVLEATRNPRAYAQCLTMLAEKSFMRRSVMLAQAAVSRIGQTSQRVARILRSERPQSRRTWKIALPSFATVLVLSVASVSRMPELVVFENSAPQTAPATAKITEAKPSPMTAAAGMERQLKAQTGTEAGASKGHIRNSKSDEVLAAIQAPAMSPKARQPESNVVETKLKYGRHDHRMTARETPASEVVIVFVAGQQNGTDFTTLWQVQMWHITVLRTSQNPTRQKASQKVI